MSSAEVFSYALLLKGADRAAEILALLDEQKREVVETALDRLKSIPPEVIRQRWLQLRTTEDLRTAAAK